MCSVNVTEHKKGYNKLIGLMSNPGHLLPEHNTGLRRRPPHMKGNCENAEESVTDDGQGIILQQGHWAGG
jgi:hypothetical protein